MTYRQYIFLKELYKINPDMNDEQRYPSQYVIDIEKKTKMSKAEVLTLAKELEKLGYVYLVQNSADETGGFMGDYYWLRSPRSSSSVSAHSVYSYGDCDNNLVYHSNIAARAAFNLAI